MRVPTLREAGTEARLLLIGIPVFLWTMIPIYHMFLFAISPKEDAFSGKLWPDHPTLHNFEIVFKQQEPSFGKISLHSRGELLFGLASGWSILGDDKKARAYLELVLKWCGGTRYEREAKNLLGLSPRVIQHNCSGCHAR